MGAIAAGVRADGRRARTWPVAGGLAVVGEPGSPYNKVIGLGFDDPPDAETLDEIEAAHADLGARVQVELSTLANPDTGRLLTGRGYRLAGFENVLARRLDDAQAPIGEVLVSEVTSAETDAWMQAVIEAFLHPDVFDGPASHESFDHAALDRAYRDSISVPGMVGMLARIGDHIAGGAALYVRDRTAMLCGAGTLPAFRRRGVQSALLSARLVRARAAGCDLAVVTTQPGSKSQENVQRAGFELIYSRAVLVSEQ